MDHGLRVAKALRKNAAQSKLQAPDLWKSMPQSFMSEFLQAYSAQPQNQAYNQLAQAITQLGADLGKTVALGAPLATGLVPYDLTSPSRLIYPVYSPSQTARAY
jgi:hypothetical protein